MSTKSRAILLIHHAEDENRRVGESAVDQRPPQHHRALSIVSAIQQHRLFAAPNNLQSAWPTHLGQATAHSLERDRQLGLQSLNHRLG